MQVAQRAATPLDLTHQSEDEILRIVDSRLAKDLTFDSGKIVGSMCTRPHPIARKVFIKYLEKNLGDAGLFPGTAQLENEAVRALGELLGNPNASGHIVSGGTEANIVALWAARNLAKGKRDVILSTSAHFSFDKAADLLGLRLRKVPVTSEFRVDPDEIRKAIRKNTLAIVGIAGTTDVGAVDPIPELAEIAIERGVFLHVDASFGGFVIPFLPSLGFEAPQFDFRVEGVQSITIDPHKMGLAPVPAGGILFRDEAILRAVSHGAPYMSGGGIRQSTVLGTRTGASAIAVWTLLRYLGSEGYRKIVSRCMARTAQLVEGISRIPHLKLVAQPTLNVAAIGSDTLNIHDIAQELRHRGWAVGVFPSHIRIVLMPHVRPTHIRSFLKDIRTAVGTLTR